MWQLDRIMDCVESHNRRCYPSTKTILISFVVQRNSIRLYLVLCASTTNYWGPMFLSTLVECRSWRWKSASQSTLLIHNAWTSDEIVSHRLFLYQQICIFNWKNLRECLQFPFANNHTIELIIGSAKIVSLRESLGYSVTVIQKWYSLSFAWCLDSVVQNCC